MGLMKELNDLNAIYLKMHEQEVSEDQTKGYVVTAADKKANTPAWQGYKKGVKSKVTGKPLYRAADHLKNEGYEEKKKGEVLSAMKKQGRKLSDKDKNKIADKVVKDKGDTSKSDDRYAYEDHVWDKVADMLTELGKLNDVEFRVEGYQRNPEKGEKEDRKYEKVRGERTPMPPRGNKRREEFERWYAANVR